MDNIIKVTEREGKQLVSARELYDFLDIKERFSKWILRMFDYGFKIHEDYTPYQMVHPLNNQQQDDYVLTLDCAKEISMIQRTDKGKQARMYFIECERRLKASPLQELSRKEILQLALKAEEEKEILLQQKLLLEKTAQQQAPKVIYYDEVLQSDSAHLTTLIAKELGMSAKTLNKELKQRKIIINVSGSWVLSAKYQNLEFTKTKTYTFTDANGKPQTSIQTLWTEKGRKFIHDLFKVKTLTL